MTDTVDVHANPILTLQVDLVSLLREGKLLDYDEDTDEARYAPDFESSIIKAAAEKIVKDFARDEIKTAIREQVQSQVAAAVQTALDVEVQITDQFGRAEGDAKPLRSLLIDRAAEQLRKWLKASDRFSGGTEFDKFLVQQVDRAMREDLNETVKVARAEVKAAMQKAAAKAIADAAASAVKGL